MFQRFVLAAVFAVAVPVSVVHAQRPIVPLGPMTSGYLCCNLRSYGNTVSDVNYDEATLPLAVGTPAQITGYDYRWFEANVGGRPQRFKNDYSRDLPIPAFAQRYIVTEDPRLKLAGFEPKLRDAILAGRLLPGMTRDQVVMTLGWPISSENPRFEATTWRYWLSAFGEYQVAFDAEGKLRNVTGDASALDRLWGAP